MKAAKHTTMTAAEHAETIEAGKFSGGRVEQKPAVTKPASDGYENVPDDRFELAGFWSPERGPLHGVLLGGFEYVQKSGKSQGQTSRVYVFKLLDPCEGTYYTYDLNGQRQGLTEGELAAGDTVGVFDSADLRRLRKLKGAAVKLARKPQKAVLKNGNEMWEFDIRSRGRGTFLDFVPARPSEEAPF